MAKVDAGGHVTISRAIRVALRIGPGDPVALGVDRNGRVVLRKADAGGPRPVRFDRVRGSAGTGMSTDAVMAPMRGN
jgi:antitoxin PrlF